MTDLDAEEPLVYAVGLLLWRSSPGGPEVLVIELDGKVVLPKGTTREGEDERAAVMRLARDLCASEVSEAAPHPPPEDEGGAIGWWKVQWSGPVFEGDQERRGRLRWFSLAEASVELQRASERRLVPTLSEPSRLRRFADSLFHSASTARRQRAEREDHRAHVESLARGPWQARALGLMQRAIEAELDRDHAAARNARAEAKRLEVYGLGERALEVLRADLELPGASREELDQALAKKDAAHAVEDDRSRAESQDRLTLLALLATGLVGVWFAGESLHARGPMFGLVGATLSTLVRGERGFERPAIGALLAGLVVALLQGSEAVSFTPTGWNVACFLAGLAERFVTLPSRRAD